MKMVALRAHPVEVSRYRLRVLGTFAIESVTDGLDCTPRGRKARALLAYLCLARCPVAREKLVSLLWSERGEPQAQASLRQSLLELKAFVRAEPPLLVADRERVALDGALFETDLDEIERLASNRDAAAVAALLPARDREFLHGLDGIDPGFDEWLLPERAAQLNGLIRTATTCGEDALARGDNDGARAVAERLAALDPWNEAAARLAMKAAAASGDLDSVRRAYALVESRLARDLDAAPSAATASVYKRLMAQRSSGEAATSAATVPEGPHVKPSRDADETVAVEAAPTPRPRWRLAAAGLVLLAVAGGTLALRQPPAAASSTVVRVDPFDVQASDVASAGFSRDLSADLFRFANVVERGFAVVEPGLGSEASEADYVVRASIRAGDGKAIRAIARLVRTDDGEIVWSNSFEGPPAEVDAVREQMAFQITNVMACTDTMRRRTASELDNRTVRLLFSACAGWRDKKDGETVRLFKQVVERRPEFAAGWAWLGVAEAFEVSKGNTQLAEAARRHAARALELDPGEGNAYLALAMTTVGRDRFAKKVRLLEKALARDPHNAIVWHEYRAALFHVGRLDEGLAAARRSAALDPFCPWKTMMLLHTLIDVGQAEAASHIAAKGERFWPEHMPVSRFLIAVETGDYARALRMLETDGDLRKALGSHARLYRQDLLARIDPVNREQLLSDLQRIVAADRTDGNAVVMLAANGLADEAYRALADAPPENWAPDILFLRETHSIRRDPRFMTLAQKHGLVDYWLTSGRWPDFCGEPNLPYSCRSEAVRLQRAEAGRTAARVAKAA